jgi:hypothetical protein
MHKFLNKKERKKSKKLKTKNQEHIHLSKPSLNGERKKIGLVFALKKIRLNIMKLKNYMMIIKKSDCATILTIYLNAQLFI